MSQNVELSGTFTGSDLDVYAAIKTDETEPHYVHYRFVIPQGIEVAHGRRIEGDLLIKPGEEHLRGITLSLSKLSPAQIDEAKLKLVKVETVTSPTHASVDAKADGDTKTIEQLCESARESRDPFGRQGRRVAHP